MIFSVGSKLLYHWGGMEGPALRDALSRWCPGGFAAKAPPRNIVRSYAVSVLSLRQSGTFLFYCVPFCRAERGKTAHRGWHVPCCRRQKVRRCDAESRNCVSPIGCNVRK